MAKISTGASEKLTFRIEKAAVRGEQADVMIPVRLQNLPCFQ